MGKSLRMHVSLAMLLLSLATIGFIGILSNIFINREFTGYLTGQEQLRSETIVGDIGRQYDIFQQTWNLDYLELIGMYSMLDGYAITVYDLSGQVVWGAMEHDMSLSWYKMDEISALVEELGTADSFTTQTYDIDLNGQKVGTATIAYHRAYFHNKGDFFFIRSINLILLGIGIAAVIFSLLGGYIWAGRISRPVTQAAFWAQQIARGNYGIRFESQTKMLELDALATAIHHLSDALNEQENLRRRLTTDVAHELRTPLTALSAHLEAMITGLWEMTAERLKGCYDEVRRLGNLVSELEQLAQVESDNLNLQLQSVDLGEIAQTAADNMESQARSKNLTLTLAREAVSVRADSDRLNQVMINLLSNAIKFTPEGGEIQVTVTENKESGQIRIKDNGIGIPEREQPWVFERFYRTDQSRSRKTGGSGIGLSIVKSIVTAHGGTVSVESRSGEGSCFTVCIPK